MSANYGMRESSEPHASDTAIPFRLNCFQIPAIHNRQALRDPVPRIGPNRNPCKHRIHVTCSNARIPIRPAHRYGAVRIDKRWIPTLAVRRVRARDCHFERQHSTVRKSVECGDHFPAFRFAGLREPPDSFLQYHNAESLIDR